MQRAPGSLNENRPRSEEASQRYRLFRRKKHTTSRTYSIRLRIRLTIGLGIAYGRVWLDRRIAWHAEVKHQNGQAHRVTWNTRRSGSAEYRYCASHPVRRFSCGHCRTNRRESTRSTPKSSIDSGIASRCSYGWRLDSLLCGRSSCSS